MTNTKILVIAGNFQQFKLWCEEHGVNPRYPNPFVYCSNTDVVRGLRFSNILYCGTGRERKDIDIDQIRATSMDEQDVLIKRLQFLIKRLEDDAEMLKTLKVMEEMEAQ